MRYPVDHLINFKIESLEDPNHRIRDLVQKRIVDFNKQIISGNMKNGMQVLIFLFPNTYFEPLFCTHIFLVSLKVSIIHREIYPLFLTRRKRAKYRLVRESIICPYVASAYGSWNGGGGRVADPHHF